MIIFLKKQKNYQNQQFNSPFCLIFLIFLQQPIKNTAIIPKPGKIKTFILCLTENHFIFCKSITITTKPSILYFLLNVSAERGTLKMQVWI